MGKSRRKFGRLPRALGGALLIALMVLVVAAATNDSGENDFQRVASGSSSTTPAAPTSTSETRPAPAAPSDTGAAPTSTSEAIEIKASPVSTPPSSPASAPSVVAGPSTTPATSTPATSAQVTPTPTTETTIRGKTAGEWAQPAEPYHYEIVDLSDAIRSAATRLDLTTVQEKSGELADVARKFRLALESSGPPPPSIAVEGPAVIAAASGLERNARAVASCVGPTDCTEALNRLSAAGQSYLNAVLALTNRIQAGG